MARVHSQTSDGSLAELRTTKGALDQRWRELTAQLGSMLGQNAQKVRIDAEAQSDRVWAGLQGSACERVTRNRGGAASVAPLCTLPRNLVAWLGLQEVWDIRAGPRPYVFRQLGLTIHFGYTGDPVKPQVFRLEWPGVRDWTGAGLAFQTPGAGHPHWQIDILQSLAEETRAESFTVAPTEIIEDFGSEPSTPELDELLRSITLENMHLASAARWWMPSTSCQSGQHMNAPPDLAGLTRWVAESVSYVKQELGRCVLRR